MRRYVQLLQFFRPERIADWRTFRVSVVLFVLAVALPGLVMLTPAAEKGGDFADQLILRAVLATSGLLTASSIYFLLSCLARPASRGDAP